MKYITFDAQSPEENLAADEVFLDAFERESEVEGALRYWTTDALTIVLGYSNRVANEVDTSAAISLGARIRRRVSGGGSVTMGVGCLNYSLLLRMDRFAELATVSGTNRFVMERNARALSELGAGDVRVQGYTDLTLGALKFSGNSQRRKLRYALFHGTLLLDFDLALIGKTLKFPPRIPEYRGDRSHDAFVTNFPVDATRVMEALRLEWSAVEELGIPDGLERVESLAREKYGSDAWNFKY